MGTEKRERQKSARLLKIEESQQAAKRDRTKRTAVRGVIAVLVIIAGVFAYSTIWGGDDDDTSTSASDSTDTTTSTTAPPSYTNPELADEVLAREAPETVAPPADTAPDALEISTLIEGQGDVVVAAGDSLVVHYTGKTADDAVFDSSWERGEPFGLPPNTLVIGQGQVIPGWDEGLIGAKIGERRHLVIGSNKAYGAEGRPPQIPASSPLAFDVDIVDVIKAASAPPTTVAVPTP